jgi:cell division transport system permease protein
VPAVILRLCGRGVRDLGRNPFAQGLTLAAVTLVAFLGGLFLLVLHNLDQELLAARGRFSFQVYWKAGAAQEEVAKQWAELRKLPGLVDLATFTPDQALSDLTRSLKGSMDTAALEALRSQNPLPATALLNFSGPAGDPEGWAKDLLTRLQAAPGVDKVHYNPLQADLARSWMGFTRKVVWPLMAFMGLVVALTVGNTIKLALLGRASEVEILQLVGAGRWYIRLPLIVGGAVQGLVGAGLALAMLKAVQAGLAQVLAGPGSSLAVRFLPAWQCAALAGVVTLVCLLSSLVALRD